MRPEAASACFENLKPLVETHNVSSFAFTGGEPLASFELLLDLLSRMKEAFKQLERRYSVQIGTTGLLLRRDKIVNALAALRMSLDLHVKQEQHFHPDGLRVFEHDYLKSMLMHKGLDLTFEPVPEDSKPVAVGKAFHFPRNMLRTALKCEDLGICYVLAGEQVFVAPVVGLQPSRASVYFDIDTKALLHACCFETFALGDLSRQSLGEISDSISRNERQRAFLEAGPLGAAQVDGKLVQAVELMKEKGPCGVCYALQQNLL